MAPAEATQERPEGRGRLDAEAQDPLRPTGAQCVRIVDAVAPGEGRHDEGQELVTWVRPAELVTEIEMLVDETLEAKMNGQRGRQEEPLGPGA